jgi:hypothetical protein
MPEDKKAAPSGGYDFDQIIGDINKIKKTKAPKAKKPSTSAKPLKFDPNPNDSELKAAIIKRINDANLTYADIYKYCTELKNGDIAEGQRFGYNIISGLKHRPTMIDNTFLILCNFLGLEITLVPRVVEKDGKVTEEEKKAADKEEE